jgi:RND family efflux transporter MFP subunit
MSESLSSRLDALRIDRSPPPPPSRGLPGWLGWVIGAIVIGGAIYAGIGVLRAKMNVIKVKTTTVSVFSATDSLVSLTATGYLVPQVTAKVGAQVAASVVKTLVAEGDRVAEGSGLFELDAKDAEAAVASAEARRAAAQSRVKVAESERADTAGLLEREKGLVASGVSLAANVDDLGRKLAMLDARIVSSKADVKASDAEVEALRTGLGKFTIAAPFTGIIATRPVAPGTVAAPGATLVEIIDPTSLLVEADVPESRLHQLSLNMPAEIILDSRPDDRLAGRIVGFSAKVDRAKATGIVRIKLDPPVAGLMPDMATRIRFLKEAAKKEAAPKTVVPASALVACGGSQCGFEIVDGKAKQVVITTGPAVGDGFEVLGGVPPGTRLIQSPPATLTEGAAVEQETP